MSLVHPKVGLCPGRHSLVSRVPHLELPRLRLLSPNFAILDRGSAIQIIALRQLLGAKRDVILILPFVAIVEEKAAALEVRV